MGRSLQQIKLVQLNAIDGGFIESPSRFFSSVKLCVSEHQSFILAKHTIL